MSFLAKLQQQPEEQRVAIAQMAAVVVVLVLFGVWFFGLSYEQQSAQVTQKQRQQAAASVEAVKALWEDATDSFASFSEQMQKLPVGAQALELRNIDPQSPDAEALIQRATENYVKVYLEKDRVRFEDMADTPRID